MLEKQVENRSELQNEIWSRPELQNRPDLAELQNEVRTTKWKQLGLLHNDLVSIGQQCRDDIDSCRGEMFSWWLQTNPNASRKQLLSALRTNAVSEMTIAKQYETYISTLESKTTTRTAIDLSVQVDSFSSSDPTREQSISPRHSHQIKISERYQPEFGSKRVDLALLISEIRDMLKTKDISLDALKSFWGYFIN